MSKQNQQQKNRDNSWNNDMRESVDESLFCVMV